MPNRLRGVRTSTREEQKRPRVREYGLKWNGMVKNVTTELTRGSELEQSIM